VTILRQPLGAGGRAHDGSIDGPNRIHRARRQHVLRVDVADAGVASVRPHHDRAARAVAGDLRQRLIEGSDTQRHAVERPRRIDPAAGHHVLRIDVVERIPAPILPGHDRAARAVTDELRILLNTGGGADCDAVRRPARDPRGGRRVRRGGERQHGERQREERRRPAACVATGRMVSGARRA
jgi:hypothetical protein